MFKLKLQKGFTLVEFMIVVAIIVILATISVISLNGQKARARDAKRISDIRQISTALESYFSDNGEYPMVLEPIILGKNNVQKLCGKAEGGFVSQSVQCNLESTYLTVISSDPLSNQNITYTGTANGYDISFITEETSALGPNGRYHAHSESIDNNPGNR